MTQPVVPMLSMPHLKAWPKHDQGGVARYLTIGEALSAAYATDAHFACYSAPTVKRRLDYGSLGKTPVVMVAACFDVDFAAAHKSGKATGDLTIDAWWLSELVKLQALLLAHPDAYVYRTRNGYRIVYLLSVPYELRSQVGAQGQWTPLYCSWVCYLQRRFGIVADSACKDWNRIYRLPRATRTEGGSPEQRETVGNAREIGIWEPELTDDDRAAAEALAKRKESTKTKERKQARDLVPAEPRADNGVLYEVLRARGHIGHQIEPGKFAIVCPRASEHSKGADFDTSTILLTPRYADEELGYIYCSHGGHGHDRFNLRDWLSCFEQSELDEARARLGLRAFKSMSYDSNGASIAERRPEKKLARLPVDDANGPDGVSYDPHKYALTDLGNAERLVRDHGEDLRYVATKNQWLVWSGTHWPQDEKSEVLELAKATVRTIYAEAEACDDDNRRQAIAKHAVKSEQSARIAAMVELARTTRSVVVLPQELDADPWMFCCDNGTIDLRTGELLGHSKGDLISRISPVTYDLEATSEVWESYLLTATGEDIELRAYLQRAVGYALQGTVTEKKFFFIHGPANSGKSVFINAIAGVFGPYHEATAAETWLAQTYTGGNRGDLVRLMRSRLVTAVEFRKGAKFDEGLIKKVTGGDAMAYSAKYEKEQAFTATFALWLAANDPPAIRDDDAGMWSRVMRIPFTTVIAPEQMDHQLGEKLREPKAQSAILRWAVEGCLMWQRDGLGTCAAVEKSNADYRGEMDRAAGFMEEELVFAPNQRVAAFKIRKAYEGWCEQNGVIPLSTKELAARLREKGATEGKSGSERFWKGVRLVDDLFDRDIGTRGDTFSRNPPHENCLGQVPGNHVPDAPTCPKQGALEYDPDDDGRGRWEA